MAELKAGVYSVQEILDAADFDFSRAEGDFRRVKISKNIGFDDLDKKVNLLPGGEPVTVDLDGEEVGRLKVVE